MQVILESAVNIDRLVISDLKSMTSQKHRKVLRVLDEFTPYKPSKSKARSAYQCLISTILSAQTTAAQTRIASKSLFDIASDPASIIKLGEENIRRLIKNVGLWRNKAKAIYRSSVIVLDKYAGEIPADLEVLKSLPGVGLKTASIVMAFYFGKPAMPVDTHIFRCARRWGLSNARTADGVSRDLQGQFPSYEWNKLHVQIISFARQYCTAKKHIVNECPMCSWAYVLYSKDK